MAYVNNPNDVYKQIILYAKFIRASIYYIFIVAYDVYDILFTYDRYISWPKQNESIKKDIKNRKKIIIKKLVIKFLFNSNDLAISSN